MAKKAAKATKAAKKKKVTYDRRWRKSSGRTQKRTGNPFVAVRVPRDVLRAFEALAKKKGSPTAELVRKYMSRATGVSLSKKGEE